MKRRHLAPVALALVLVVSGCLGFGGISDEELCEETDYDWSTDADARFTVAANGSYTAVYRIENTSQLELFSRDGLGNDQPVSISAVQFREPDGTVHDCESITVETTRRETTIDLPAEEGQLAYTGDSSPKRFSTRTFVDGSYEVVLPEDREISNPIFGSVQPGGFETETVEGRLHIRWEEVDSRRVAVQYYLGRDIPLFFGIALVAGVAALGGIAYYYRLIKKLKRRREEAGLDVDDDDEFDRDPPPGFG